MVEKCSTCANNSQALDLIVRLARNNLAGKHSVAQDLVDQLLEIGYEMIEKADGKKKSNIINLNFKKKRHKLNTEPTIVSYELAAELLNSIRAYRLSTEIEVPQISDDTLDEMFEKILTLDKQLELN